MWCGEKQGDGLQLYRVLLVGEVESLRVHVVEAPVSGNFDYFQYSICDDLVMIISNIQFVMT